MTKLNLYIGEKLQGNFIPQKLNLLLIFQVNCPGCFLYALPVFKKLFDAYSKEMGFLALSTAFEDYQLNTSQSTRKLIESGEIFGETKKALKGRGINRYPVLLDFPIAMDAKMKTSDTDEVVRAICSANPNFDIWSAFDQNLMRQNIEMYLSKQYEVSMTFTSNQFKGTPTFVLFNDEHQIINSWFGHISPESIAHKIESTINSDG